MEEDPSGYVQTSQEAIAAVVHVREAGSLGQMMKVVRTGT